MNRVPVGVFREGRLVHRFESVREASQATGLNHNHMQRLLNSGQPHEDGAVYRRLVARKRSSSCSDSDSDPAVHRRWQSASTGRSASPTNESAAAAATLACMPAGAADSTTQLLLRQGEMIRERDALVEAYQAWIRDQMAITDALAAMVDYQRALIDQQQDLLGVLALAATVTSSTPTGPRSVEC